MGESTDVIPRIEETDTEIELSAQELIALSDLPQVDEPATSPALRPSRAAKSAPSRNLSLPLSLIAAVGVVGATYALMSPERANQSTADTSQPLAQAAWPAPQQFAASEPVRFANPFDADEVFEFPPGTTEAQARDAVAEALLQRAVARQKT